MCAAEGSRIGHAADAALWAEVIGRWDALGICYDAAYARWRRAEALLAVGGERDEIELILRTAHQVTVDLDARPLRAELEALGRRARIALGDPRSGDPSAALEQAELTPREIEVLTLLADGLTNRAIAAELFISSKTVSVHVSRILGKLAVPNRAAAAAAASGLGISRSGASSAVQG